MENRLKTFLALNAAGETKLVVQAKDASAVPTELNGEPLTARELSSVEKETFDALPALRSGTVFDGTKFTALPPTQDQIDAAASPAKVGG